MSGTVTKLVGTEMTKKQRTETGAVTKLHLYGESFRTDKGLAAFERWYRKNAIFWDGKSIVYGIPKAQALELIVRNFDEAPTHVKSTRGGVDAG